jgi:class 3 adenylate cyclase
MGHLKGHNRCVIATCKTVPILIEKQISAEQAQFEKVVGDAVGGVFGAVVAGPIGAAAGAAAEAATAPAFVR